MELVSKSWLWNVPDEWIWENYIVSLSLSFLIYEWEWYLSYRVVVKFKFVAGDQNVTFVLSPILSLKSIQ